MKKTVKKVISSVLVAAMLLSFVPMSGVEDLTFDFTTKSSAAEMSGQIGEVSYVFDEETGTLTISGKGEINDSLWEASLFSRNSVKSVIIEDGITSIGSNAFSNFAGVTNVSIPNSVTEIGY